MSTASSSDSRSQIIDFACHHYPEEVVSESRKRSPLWQHLGPIPYDIDALTKRINHAGIDKAVLSMPGLEDESVAGVERANDVLHDVIDGSDQFFGLASLPLPAGGEAAASEFERCIDLGFNGGTIKTRSGDTEIHDRELDPLYEVADETGAPLFVHPKLHDSLAPDALDDTYYHNAIFGREIALCVSISNVIHEELFDRFGNLRFVFHHLGGNIASMLGRVEVHGDRRRWPFKDTLIPHSRFERSLERIYLDTSGHLDYRPALSAATSAFPPSNLLFGTDTPWEARSPADIGDYVSAVEDVVPSKYVPKVLAENALDILVNV